MSTKEPQILKPYFEEDNDAVFYFKDFLEYIDVEYYPYSVLML